ncbi:MAG: glycoside hydrolase family 26 protein [Salinivirgaceae bacterium]
MIRCLGLLVVLALAGLLQACKNESNFDSQVRLSDKSATPESMALFAKLELLSKKGSMLGHQDAVAYGIGWESSDFRSDINDVCGDFPAVFGWDLGHIGDSVNIDGVPFERMLYWARIVHQKGGINTYSWHARNMHTDASSWDLQTNIPDLLPGGEKHEHFLHKLDLLADFFNALTDSDGKLIPVVFRPYHEMNGHWFWWGTKSCTADEYKNLFRFTVDYLRENKQVHQVMYSYSPDVYETAAEYLEFYPGDNYVDIFGVDDYKGIRSRETVDKTINRLSIISKLSSEKNKLFTLSETGFETLSDSLWFSEVLLPVITSGKLQTKPLWVLLWRNARTDHFYAPYPGHSSVADFITFKNHPLTLFLNDIQ